MDEEAPRRGASSRSVSQKVMGVVIDAVLFQKFLEFLSESPLVMMNFLPGDIPPYRLHPAGADSEYRVSLLPLKSRLMVRGGPY